jgi:acyl-CoA synthetase (AMP-forming)/AMP-acid ligase II
MFPIQLILAPSLRYGIVPGSKVALLMPPCAEFTLLQLAAIKLGAFQTRID